MSEICCTCKMAVADDELVYCYTCGAPHHESCFHQEQSCGTVKCPGTIFVSNGTGETRDCSQKGDRITSGKSPVEDIESDREIPEGSGTTNPWGFREDTPDQSGLMMAISMLFSLIVVLLVTVAIVRWVPQ